MKTQTKRNTKKPIGHRRVRKTSAPSSRAIVRVAPAPERPWELSNEQVVLLKNYLKIADASEVELKGCLEVARRYRIDPFKQGQIWFIKRWDKNAASVTGTKGAFVYTPQVGIYGMLHIAARDYKDFGSISEAEFGPMFTHEVEGHKFKAPEWCRVKVYKKSLAQPTVATIYFEEFCPAIWDNVRLFWAKMPRAQIEKCAKARAIRTAYPDLGGLYIPEEMDRMKDEYTQSGRQVVETPSGGSHAAAQAVLAEKLTGKRPLAPSEPEKPATEPPKASIPNTPIEVKPQAWKGTVELDFTDETSPIVRGDISEILDALQKYCKTMKWIGEWWHIEPRDVETLKALCIHLGFRVLEVLPKEAPKQPAKTPESSKQTNEPTLISGVIEQANPESGKSPRVSVLFKIGKAKHWMSAFDTALFAFLIGGKGQEAELFVTKVVKGDKTFTNIIGLRRVGSKQFDSDMKTPVIQNRDREAGGRTLFP
jgi:hypothetical protein